MVVLAPSSTPTRADASAAAVALAAEGASMVLLFGSVARGTASPHSDIDLVAIFDDLDYSQRFERKAALMAVAAAAAQREVDVLVTDRPEWRWRTTRVSASVEAAIAGDAVTLLDSGPGVVQWDKEIGLARTNEEECLGRIEDARLAFISLQTHLRPNLATTWLGPPPSPADIASAERVRLRDLCSAAAEVIESTTKAFRAVSDPSGRLSHDILALLPQTGEHRAAIEEALAPVRANTIEDPRRAHASHGRDFNDVGLMRIAGLYTSEVAGATFERLAELAPRICAAAVSVAVLSGERLGQMMPEEANPTEPVVTLAEIGARVGRYLREYSLVTGGPLRGASPCF